MFAGRVKEFRVRGGVLPYDYLYNGHLTSDLWTGA